MDLKARLAKLEKISQAHNPLADAHRCFTRSAALGTAINATTLDDMQAIAAGNWPALSPAAFEAWQAVWNANGYGSEQIPQHQQRWQKIMSVMVELDDQSVAARMRRALRDAKAAGYHDANSSMGGLHG